MTLKERIEIFLNEFSFVDSKDVDYTFSDIVITSDGTSEYKIGGKTHGLISHAIKHLIEFDNVKVKKDVDAIIKILNDNIDKLKFIHRVKGIIKPVNLSEPVVLTSLDYINDKIKTNQKLSPVEKEIYPYIKSISNEYRQFVELFMKEAIKIEDTDDKESILNKLKRGMVMFDISFGDERVYLDLKRSIIIITLLRKGNAVKTMFKLNNGKVRALEILKRKVVSNPEIENAIKLF